MGEINSGVSGAKSGKVSDIMVAGGSSRVEISAREGIGGERSLAIDTSLLTLENDSGDVSIVGQRELNLESISQRGLGEIQVTSEKDITLGGGDVFVGAGNLKVETEGELQVVSELSSTMVAIALKSDKNITLDDGISVTTEGAQAEMSLDAEGNIMGEDHYLNTAGVHLTSRGGTIGSSSGSFTATASNIYQTIDAPNGVYLTDPGKDLTIETTNEGMDDAAVAVIAEGNWMVGHLNVGDNDLSIDVGGDFFGAEQLSGDSVEIDLDDASARARIETVSLSEGDFSSQANNLEVENLQSSSPDGVEISIVGVDGEHADNISIASDTDLHVTFSELSTQRARLEFDNTNRLSFASSNISDYMYLTSKDISLVLAQQDYLPFPADVVIHVPNNGLLNLEVNQTNYNTSAVILDAGSNVFGGDGNGSALDNTGRVTMQVMSEINSFLDDASSELGSKVGEFILKLVRAVGIEIDGDNVASVSNDDIRNDFLQVIEVDRISNSFSSPPGPKERDGRKPASKK